MQADIRYVTPMKWILHRNRLLAYAEKHGDGRVTGDALRVLAGLDPLLLGRPDRTGAAAAVVRQDGIVVGFAAAVGRGRDACVVVVHPAARGRGIGTRLTAALPARLGFLACLVADGNAPAAAMCRRAGLQPAGVSIGPGGKLTRMEGAFQPDAASARQAGSE